jgi:hypothetical protein
MKQKNHKLWKYGILLFLFCIAAICLLQAYSYLSVSRPVKPDILVVEGWLSEDLLAKAEEEFAGKPYKLLITTGFPYWKGFQMGQDGKMVFRIPDNLKPAHDSLYNISITIRGTQCEGEFAHYKLFADTILIGDSYSTKKTKTFEAMVKMSSPPDSVILEFDNDAYTSHRDRDLFIYSSAVNEIVLPVNSNMVFLYGSREGKYEFKKHLNTSTATDAAGFLRSAKLPDSMVIAVETTHTIYSKTYTSALDVKQWLEDNHMDKGRSLTVFTMGLHARRSLVCYKKAFGKNAEIGVLAGKDNRITDGNWYRTLRGWKDIASETAGLIYISILPKPRRS